MIRFSLLAAGSALALAAGISTASASQAGYYVSGMAGASLLPSLHLSHTPTGTLHEDFGTGYALGGAVGYDDGAGKRIELDTLYSNSDLNSVAGVPTHGHLDSLSLMLNGQVDLMQHTAVVPYIGAGIGLQEVGARIGALHGQNWEPAYQLDAGLRHQISKDVDLFGEYRFSQSEASHLDGGGLSANQHFSDHAILAGLRFHLG